MKNNHKTQINKIISLFLLLRKGMQFDFEFKFLLRYNKQNYYDYVLVSELLSFWAIFSV